jgi:hypothetical protein
MNILNKLKSKIPNKLLFFLTLGTEAVSMGAFILVFLAPDRLMVLTQYLVTMMSVQVAIAQFLLGSLSVYFYIKWHQQSDTFGGE